MMDNVFYLTKRDRLLAGSSNHAYIKAYLIFLSSIFLLKCSFLRFLSVLFEFLIVIYLDFDFRLYKSKVLLQ